MKLPFTGQLPKIDSCHTVRAGRTILEDTSQRMDRSGRDRLVLMGRDCNQCDRSSGARMCAFETWDITGALGGIPIEKVIEFGPDAVSGPPPPPDKASQFTPEKFANTLIGAVNAGVGGPGNAALLATKSLQDVVIRDHVAGVPLSETASFLDKTSGHLDQIQYSSLFGTRIVSTLKRQIEAMREIDPRLTNPQFNTSELHYFALLAAFETAMFTPVDHILSVRQKPQRVPLYGERVGRVLPPVPVNDDQRIMTSLELLNGLNWPNNSTSQPSRIDKSRSYSIVPLLKSSLFSSPDEFDTTSIRQSHYSPAIHSIAGLALRVSGGVNGGRYIANFSAAGLQILPPIFTDELYRLLLTQTLAAEQRTVNDPAIANLTEKRYAHISGFVDAMSTTPR